MEGGGSKARKESEGTDHQRSSDVGKGTTPPSGSIRLVLKYAA